jgi:hypothetical protein
MHEVTPLKRETERARAGYAEWIALGAVVAGSVGAIVGAAQCVNRASGRSRLHVSDHPDSSTLTAPHGDKLLNSWQ